MTFNMTAQQQADLREMLDLARQHGERAAEKERQRFAELEAARLARQAEREAAQRAAPIPCLGTGDEQDPFEGMETEAFKRHMAALTEALRGLPFDVADDIRQAAFCMAGEAWRAAWKIAGEQVQREAVEPRQAATQPEIAKARPALRVVRLSHLRPHQALTTLAVGEQVC